MLTTIWTASLICLFALLLGAWLAVFCYERGVHPLRDFVQFLKSQPVPARFLWILFFTVTWVVASNKQNGGTDGGGTNTMQMTGCPMGAPQMTGGLNATFSPFTSTNTTRSLTAADFDRGFVLTQVGTNELFDFSAPTQATVCADWRAFGAATDWLYHSSTNWTFRINTNDIDRLRIFSHGRIEPFVRTVDGTVATNIWFAPLEADLGIVPEANWGMLTNATESNFWHAFTPSNTLQLTWYNALLNRTAETPVSFQTEFGPSGTFQFRYDFSRLGVEAVSNILVGASLNGACWTTNALPANVTSLAFHPLSSEDATNPDPDDDGIPTIDELFVYRTDPHAADTDLDGLSDYDELFVHHTDPLNPHSVSETLCDGFAVKIGDLDPFSCPEGSTNTVLEHVFYTGTTNTPFAYPQPDSGSAILRVAFSGSGSGELIVGDRVVPLLAVSAGDSNSEGEGEPSSIVVTNTLLLAVEKGVCQTLWYRKSNGLDVALDSDDFCIGRKPSLLVPVGWCAFPNTKASEPCIHDLGSRRVTVSLDPGPEIEELTCTWSTAASIEVENRPPLSALLTGSFPRSATTPVTYELSHPQYLFGQRTYTQTARFCPRLQEQEEDVPCVEHGVGEEFGDDASDHDQWESVDGEDDPDEDDPDAGDSDDDCVCPVHHVDYLSCTNLHAETFSNALSIASSSEILKIYEVPEYSTIHIDVPDDPVVCCCCPDHQSRYVALAAKSYNLAVHTLDGERFTRTVADCNIQVRGIAPSTEIDDSILMLAKSGSIYERHRYTVLGLSIRHPIGQMAAITNLNQEFGYPITACTNANLGTTLHLRTDVDLPFGDIQLALRDATARFQIYLGDATDERILLLDSETRPELTISLLQWKRMAQARTRGRNTRITVVGLAEGTASLQFAYAGANGQKSYSDVATLKMTAIKSPLLPDYNHDGRIDADDAARFRTGHPYQYWINEDKTKDDYVGQNSDTDPNVRDQQVNGTYDLLNLFPIAIDLRDFTSHWNDTRLRYFIGPDSPGAIHLNVTFAELERDQIALMQTSIVMTATSTTQQLASATLQRLQYDDLELDPDPEKNDVRTLIAEATTWESGILALRIELEGVEIFRSPLPLRLTSVKDMYRFINARPLSNDSAGRGSSVDEPFNFPTGHAGAKKFFFLHGANVSADDAEFWGDQIFKRLWHAGCSVDFYNVDWRSNIGLTGANYQQNASNAFEVAAQLVTTITNIPGERVVMAHSLGNMVVSSMIQDHGLEVSRYLMCNSAVPSESYNPSHSIRIPQLVHTDWTDYPTNTWVSLWHRLFADDVDDDRRLLGWPDRFCNVVDVAVNFYSSGDEVLEIYANNNLSVLTGISDSVGHYSWHKQELFKGRADWTSGLGGTDWSGWGFRKNLLGINALSAADAADLDVTALKTNTVFRLYPTSMATNVIPSLVRSAHLTQGIPALAPPTGRSPFPVEIMDLGTNFDLNTTDDDTGISKPNGWPSRSDFTGRWLHSDIKDVSFYYNFMLYKRIKESGELP